ncbi:MAG: CRISPR-associated helicase/endonuclease Cas3, partial [Nitrospinales bacterium]
AGVDIDFGIVIRSLAGMDSIAQAAGRCNRNGENALGYVYIVNPESENIGLLPDIAKGEELTKRVFRDFKADPASLGGDLLHPKAMERFFKYYFFQRKEEMSYSVGGRNGEPVDTLLNMLSINKGACGQYRRINGGQNPSIPLCQSFMTANKYFQVIGGGTHGIIVPYGKEGQDIINDLCGAFDLEKDYKLLKRAQRYTVNVYPHFIQKLIRKDAIYEAQEDIGIYCLRKEHYSEDFGVSENIVNTMDTLTA